MKTMKKKIADLKPHPKNEEIYGYDEDVSVLVEKIRRSHTVHTMVINSQNIILAGHMRRKACIQLGIEEVDVEVRDFATPEEEIEFIIDNNATREKTVEQKSREAKALKEVEEVLAKKRQATSTGGAKPQLVAVPPHAVEQVEQGKSRDITAKKVGLRSGREADRAIKTISTIDKLLDEGRTEEADLIRAVLNKRSVSTAEELAKNIDKVDIPEEDIELIKQGKKSPYSYIEKAKREEKEPEEPKQDNSPPVDPNEFLKGKTTREIIDNYANNGAIIQPGTKIEKSKLLQKVERHIDIFSSGMIECMMYQKEIHQFTDKDKDELRICFNKIISDLNGYKNLFLGGN
ncbi:ParB/RepB/Spo0J family partition protein [Clostridium sp. HBUAS56010]|uniref:ParB/RepB/Spo0J family partition protein n=1 Tax=Clostridium sp. HBUAS56010 TaxID=2571127 RepID=UPI0011787E27|nr:ParB/RepB/Spo0J family partition protein [Clostridium sp. HBUAS56010]